MLLMVLFGMQYRDLLPSNTPNVQKNYNRLLEDNSSFTSCYFNSPPSSAAYMHQWIGSALVQIMDCRLFDANPLPELMLSYCQFGSWEEISVKFESELYHFHSRKCTWKCRLPKWRPFCLPGDELMLALYMEGTRAWFLSKMSKVSANERRQYMCYVFSDWMKPQIDNRPSISQQISLCLTVLGHQLVQSSLQWNVILKRHDHYIITSGGTKGSLTDYFTVILKWHAHYINTSGGTKGSLTDYFTVILKWHAHYINTSGGTKGSLTDCFTVMAYGCCVISSKWNSPSAWWMQMAWCLFGTRPSASIMLT